MTLGRRRLLQAGTAGLASSLAIGSALGASDHPNSIVFDGTVSRGKSKYAFAVTGDIEPYPGAGPLEVEDTIGGSSASGAVYRDEDAYRFSGELSALDISGEAEVSITYGDESDVGANRLEIVAESGASIDYSFTATDKILAVTDNGANGTDSTDSVVENSDGTCTADGSTADGSGDTFDFWGDVSDFTPMEGSYTLFLNGTEITSYDLTGEKPPDDREHSYSFEGTGDNSADYYLEVEDGGDMIASTLDGAVIESDFHWISDDRTKAAGRIDPGERHAYEFDNLVLDVTIDGEADAFVDGSVSNLDRYPQDGATGDGWKGGFPWQNREHSYSFEGTGDTWADYYLEVEDGGEMFASRLDGAVIESDFHWISDDGTKAAGRVDPGERHAYEFDNLVLDVTVDGEADAFVDGSASNLEWYPQDGATGDGWKGGFPWQDGDTTQSSGTAVGGGSGYGDTITRSDGDTDVVVRSRSELDDALAAASAGDVVFVPGGEQIDMGNRQYDVPDGVTLASNRGVDGSPGALLYTDYEPSELINIPGSGRLTGVRLKGPHPGDDTTGDSLAGGVQTLGAGEVDNCDVWGFSHHGIRAAGGDGAHIHHNVVREINKAGLGYGVGADSGRPVIEYNYFNFNRHSVASSGENPGYICRYNHFGPKTTDHVIDAHDPAGVEYQIHNNVVEAVDAVAGGNREGEQRPAFTIRGSPDDVASVYDNWFYNPDEPLNYPDGWTNEAIIQVYTDEWTNVSTSGNYYGKSAPTTVEDIIPGYDGWRTA